MCGSKPGPWPHLGPLKGCPHGTEMAVVTAWQVSTSLCPVCFSHPLTLAAPEENSPPEHPLMQIQTPNVYPGEAGLRQAPHTPPLPQTLQVLLSGSGEEGTLSPCLP